jgi:hypothetical protein
MHLSTRSAAKRREQAIKILQARVALRMTAFPEVFPGGENLLRLSLERLDEYTSRKDPFVVTRRVYLPTFREHQRLSNLGLTEVEYMLETISRGWLLLATAETSKVSITPQSIIEYKPLSRFFKKESTNEAV